MLIDPKELNGFVPLDPTRPVDVNGTLRDIEAAYYESSLYEFLKAGWRYIDPNPYVDSWHLGAIAEHLEAVKDGQITRLIINQPPRTSKSSMLVAFDPWVWAQAHKTDTSGPGVQFLHASYAQNLSIRDSVKTRRLIESPWYQKYWGNRVSITTDLQFPKSRGLRHGSTLCAGPNLGRPIPPRAPSRCGRICGKDKGRRPTLFFRRDPWVLTLTHGARAQHHLARRLQASSPRAGWRSLHPPALRPRFTLGEHFQ